MIGITLIVIGLILSYAGFTGRGPELLTAMSNGAPGYAKINPFSFAVGLLISGLPIMWLKEKQADTYIVLMLVSFLVFNYSSIERFVDFTKGFTE